MARKAEQIRLAVVSPQKFVVIHYPDTVDSISENRRVLGHAVQPVLPHEIEPEVNATLAQQGHRLEKLQGSFSLLKPSDIKEPPRSFRPKRPSPIRRDRWQWAQGNREVHVVAVAPGGVRQDHSGRDDKLRARHRAPPPTRVHSEFSAQVDAIGFAQKPRHSHAQQRHVPGKEHVEEVRLPNHPPNRFETAQIGDRAGPATPSPSRNRNACTHDRNPAGRRGISRAKTTARNTSRWCRQSACCSRARTPVLAGRRGSPAVRCESNRYPRQAISCLPPTGLFTATYQAADASFVLSTTSPASAPTRKHSADSPRNGGGRRLRAPHGIPRIGLTRKMVQQSDDNPACHHVLRRVRKPKGQHAQQCRAQHHRFRGHASTKHQSQYRPQEQRDQNEPQRARRAEMLGQDRMHLDKVSLDDHPAKAHPLRILEQLLQGIPERSDAPGCSRLNRAARAEGRETDRKDLNLFREPIDDHDGEDRKQGHDEQQDSE